MSRPLKTDVGFRICCKCNNKKDLSCFYKGSYICSDCSKKLKYENPNYINNTVSIYCLKDPRTNKIKYIGSTKNYLCNRKKVHIYQSKNSKNPSKKEQWILELLSLNLKPVIELLEIVKNKDRYEREKYYISLYTDLVNSSTGGKSGATGTVLTEKHKKHLSILMKGNKHSLGKKWSEERRKKHIAYRGGNKKIPIIQYSMELNYIKKYDSITLASKDLIIHRASIYKNLKGKIKTIHGYIFKYSNYE